MNVILRDQVESLGKFGEVVKVADGYARNYLIPKGLAVLASPAGIKQANAEKEAFLRKEQKRVEKAQKLAAELGAVTLGFAKKAGDDDRLFGSVTSHDIGDALKAKGFEIEKKGIILSEPIKTLGLHTVTVKLHSEVSAEIKIDVTRE